MKIKFKNQEYKTDAKTIREFLKETNPEAFSAALISKVDGKNVDLSTELKENMQFDILTIEDEDGKKALWHTTSHVLAYAVKNLYKDVKIAIGPATSEGFYYDFDTEVELDPALIEAEMKKIIKENYKVYRKEITKAEALKLFANEPYKTELIENLDENEVISTYQIGEFVDLCAGPHLYDLSKIKAFMIKSITGAYWHGDSKNKMLKRVYGISFRTKEELEEYKNLLELRKQRDHNKLGRDLEIFTTVDYIGQGLPIILPKGAKILQIMQRFVEDEEAKRGWLLTMTPYMAKNDLYKISGHWDHYKDGMFVLGDEEKDKEVYALRPMTCPFQYQAYLNRPRSYKDLPLRYNETSKLFRNEDSGEMHGLIRVRQFTLSEGHLMCTPEQLEEEFKSCLELAIFMLKTLGLYEDASYRFSQWDPNNREKYIGTEEDWNEVQGTMATILKDLNVPYVVGIGEAAFYGPKLDIQIKNVYGKEDTLITIQIDQFNAEKFGMEYTDKDGNKKRPIIIHRSSIGCYERTLAYLIEKTGGAFPVWLSPTQVMIIPVADRHLKRAKEIEKTLQLFGIRTEVDTRSEKVGYKIRSAQLEKIPYMVVVGDNELETGNLTIRNRSGEQFEMQEKEFAEFVKTKNDTRDLKL
ncbi:MAG: threonine--tRNA ligase [Clostridia bacterium]|nr:threonine--tRNA ligase [Clostridia bacterium]